MLAQRQQRHRDRRRDLYGSPANQSGDGIYYEAAPEATLSFPIDPRFEQTITFGPTPSLVVGGVGHHHRNRHIRPARSLELQSPNR
jgi:hypothetical protein